MVFVVAFMVTGTLVSSISRLRRFIEFSHILTFTRPAGPNFLRLAYIYLVDTRKETFNQLRCFYHIVCRHRLGPRHSHLVPTSNCYPQAANQYPQESSRRWHLLDWFSSVQVQKGLT
jgi:hypothetical protein